MVDYHIDNAAKHKIDDLPLTVHNKIVKPEEVSEYTKNHAEINNFTFSKTKRIVAFRCNLVSLDRLSVMVKHGANVTKVHRGFKFRQEVIREDFISRYIIKRKNATSASRKNLYKLL